MRRWTLRSATARYLLPLQGPIMLWDCALTAIPLPYAASCLLGVRGGSVGWDGMRPGPQGMNFLAGVLLMYLPREEDAYSALVILMQHRRLRELYKEDLAMLQVPSPWAGLAPDTFGSAVASQAIRCLPLRTRLSCSRH